MGHITRETIEGCPKDGCHTGICRVAQVDLLSTDPVSKEHNALRKLGIRPTRVLFGTNELTVTVCSGMIDDSKTSRALDAAGILEVATTKVGSYAVNQTAFEAGLTNGNSLATND